MFSNIQKRKKLLNFSLLEVLRVFRTKQNFPFEVENCHLMSTILFNDFDRVTRIDEIKNFRETGKSINSNRVVCPLMQL